METLVLQLLTHGRADTLPALFDSLITQTKKDWHLRVLVNGASPSVREKIEQVIEQYRDRLHMTVSTSEKNLGFAGGHQALFEDHNASFVLLVNDDVVLASDYIEHLLRELETRPRVGAVSGKLVRPDGLIDSLGLVLHDSGRVSNIGEGDKDKGVDGVEEVFGVAGTLPLLRREAVVQASHDGKLFDPALGTYKEDVELAFRFRTTDWKSMVIPEAVAVHHRTFRKSRLHRGVSFSAASHSYRNHAWNLLTFYSWGEFFRVAWALVPFELAKLGFFLSTNPRVIFWSIMTTWEHRKTLLAKRRHFLKRSHML